MNEKIPVAVGIEEGNEDRDIGVITIGPITVRAYESIVDDRRGKITVEVEALEDEWIRLFVVDVNDDRIFDGSQWEGEGE